MTDPADLGVEAAAAALGGRVLSSRELVDACLTRIRERDGTHSHDGDPGSVNAWARVYEEDARAAAARADERIARGDAPALCGIPLGLKDLYAAAGKPLTASSRVLDEVPERDCDAWARLAAEGMVLLGHVHTHEFGAGGTTDQVGNPWGLDLSPGGSGGGSAAALAARMVPATTGTDTAGSVRIPSAMCGTSAIKPTRDLVPMRGIVPLGTTLDHAGPMTRTVGDCEPLLAAMAGVEPPVSRRPLQRFAVSPRVADLDPDVADGFDAALAVLGGTLGAKRVAPPLPPAALDLRLDVLDVICSEMLVYHRRFDDRRDLYRPSIRGFLEYGESRAMTAEEYVAAQTRRAELTERLGRLARGASNRRDRRADRADRRARARSRLRRAVHGRRRDLSHALLELDRLPGRRAAVRRRAAKRAARQRLADRGSRRRLGPARVGRGAPGRARDGDPVIDVASVVAIDVLACRARLDGVRVRAAAELILKENAARLLGLGPAG